MPIGELIRLILTAGPSLAKLFVTVLQISAELRTRGHDVSATAAEEKARLIVKKPIPRAARHAELCQFKDFLCQMRPPSE